jgi:hypothetical protein
MLVRLPRYLQIFLMYSIHRNTFVVEYIQYKQGIYQSRLCTADYSLSLKSNLITPLTLAS